MSKTSNTQTWKKISLKIFGQMLGHGMCLGFALSCAFWSAPVQAIELNWSGQFWSEWHYVRNYGLDSSDAGEYFDASREDAQGYYITPSGGGSRNASFETLFMRLRPKIVVNDNIYIKAELWAGDPVFGLFGNSVPYSLDQRQYYSNQSRGSFITAQRYWAELLSDFGTVQIGRAPLDWGLGIVWNSGEDLWSRYPSTGDVIRVVSKFGSFSFIPGVVVYSTGNKVGGSCTVTGGGTACTPTLGSGGIADYSIALKYENLEEDLEGGVNLIKRLAGAGQDRTSLVMDTSASSNYNIWDIFARKKIGQFVFAGEIPVLSGKIGGMNYSGYALAGDVNWKPNETWETHLRFGRAPGQPSSNVTNPEDYRAFFFNPNYRLGLIMFNYQLANFAGPNTLNNTGTSVSALKSPFDNPITNATYLSLSEVLKTQKWTFNAGLIYARALETASPGSYFYNTWQRKLVRNDTGKTQANSLGTEFDLGAMFQWDDYFFFRLDTGFWFPGSYYAFSNTATDNATDTVWATSAKVGINF